MGYYDAEILIQDVNPLNAKIFGDGWMYVTHTKDKKAPLYFAPYFTSKKGNNGISVISRVMHTEIIRLANKQDTDVLGERHHESHQRWLKGLDKIRQRAKDEGFFDSEVRLLYLDKPITIAATPITKKSFNQTAPLKRMPNQIPKGFSLRFDQLLPHCAGNQAVLKGKDALGISCP